MADRYEPVGVSDIARRLGVTLSAVDRWRERDVDFPPPEGKVGGRPAWDWPTVSEWARATGRLP